MGPRREVPVAASRTRVTAAIPIVWTLTMIAARFLDPLTVIFVASVTLATIVVVRDRQRMRQLWALTGRAVALGAVAAIAMVAFTYLSFPLLIRWVPSISAGASSIYARFLRGGSLPWFLCAVIPVVIAEEVLWRGKFQDSAGRWRVVVAAAVYALAHIPLGSLLLVVVAFVCALYWSGLRQISGSLVPPLCAHLAWDIALIVFPLLR